jgi:hypothetical protein
MTGTIRRRTACGHAHAVCGTFAFRGFDASAQACGSDLPVLLRMETIVRDLHSMVPVSFTPVTRLDVDLARKSSCLCR